MRIVTLEEHVAFPEMKAFLPADVAKNIKEPPNAAQMMPKLADIAGERLKSMDDAGITMQVLSVENTDVNLLDEKLAPQFAARYNDLLAEKIAPHPERFSAFALLPMTAPATAADELERAVTKHGFRGAMIKGHVNGEFLDHPKFSPVFERAQKLGVPIYIHPGIPPKAVQGAYYSNIGGKTGYTDL
ncbi:amidohydrolase family protein [Mucilaginibacter ginkgonis]|uniref:Amidohydrolase family protein n=1 Tax=Mucilaginibacter ginkgonis TaxID=2682091 RepID=A0A7T7FCH8_9SPHI|nr:amidohydrolase family protein [Mucilaginibacter ginkgonis]QQL50764.1 amidohydrolase family protein [Mucilaginibacter ginkgonis]